MIKVEITLHDYRPLDWGQTRLWEGEGIPIPKREEITPEMPAKWATVQTGRGTIISNLVHRDFPDAYCQIQMSPDLTGTYHVFMLHHGPREKHIAEPVVDRIFLEEMVPQIREGIEKARRV